MSLLSKGVIHLDDSDDENAWSDVVEEVVQWDEKLRQTKTFMTAVAILAGRRCESPNLESQQNLFNFIDQPARDYFLSRSLQAKAFDEINVACKLGWKTEGMRKNKWNMPFTAENLALLLVLWQQAEKEKEEAYEVEQTTRSTTGGIPKVTDLKRAFRKLWKLYKNPLKLHMQAERDTEDRR